ncbi:hypothetical protein AJ88_01600 [Mesorhizobium amorphae CCBAU 01583]|nr:hypothetical protein AJ88_01600 [Mesorhizobium amorphae CCBAU 01583]
MGIAEVNLQPGVDAQVGVLRHFRSLVPSQRLTQSLGKFAHGSGDGSTDGFSAVAGKWRTVLDAQALLIAIHARKVKQHCEARTSLHECADRRVPRPRMRSPSQ